MKSIITTTFAALLLLTACSKNTATPDNDNNNQTPPPTTPPKELMVGSWTFVSVTSNDPNNPSPLDSCSYDDITTFIDDGSWMADYNNTICDTPRANLPGTWNVDNYPVLVIKHPYMIYKSENKIIQLDANTLKYERKYPDINSYVMTFTMKRK